LACGVSRKAPSAAQAAAAVEILRAKHLDRGSGNGALIADIDGGVRRLPSSSPSQPRSDGTEQWQPSPAGPDVDAPPRQTASPGLPYSAAGGTRSRLALTWIYADPGEDFNGWKVEDFFFSAVFSLSQTTSLSLATRQ